MKKFNTLLIFALMVVLAIPAVGQQISPAQMDQALLLNRDDYSITNRVIRSDTYHQYNEEASSRANTNFILDYDSLNNNDGGFFWTLNSKFTTSGNMTYAIVGFDSLADLAGTGYDYDAHTVTVDSVSIIFSHQNGSNQEDTLIMSIVELDANNHWTANVLWADSLFASTSMTAALNSFGTWTSYPEFALCDGRFGIRVDFHGPITDTVGIIATFIRDTCATHTCAPMSGNPGAQTVSAFYPSSYYGYQNGDNNLIEIPTAMGGDVFRDCDNDMSFTFGGCEAWYVQDFLFLPFVKIQDTPPAALVVDTKTQTPDNGTGNGTATITLSGGIGEPRITWGTIPPQFGSTATNLTAGEIVVLATYGHNCGIIIDTVEVMSNLAIDDLQAGITDLNAYPNPTNGQLNLDFEMGRTDDVSIKVYDLKGTMIYTNSVENVRNYNSQIDLGEVVDGIYLLRVETSQGATTRRIVKN